MKQIKCREHGGTFEIESRRGRPPVRCTEENPCNRVSRATVKTIKTATGGKLVKAKAVPRTRAEVVDAGVAEATAPIRRTRKPAVVAAEVTTTVNLSIPLAHAAKARLEPLGWLCKGRAWFADGPDALGMAEVLATRGDEILLLVWADGNAINQDYSIWAVDKPSGNNKPAHRLPFDPDEVTDSELVRILSGMRITWWNALAQKEEIATLNGGKVQIEHSYTGTGDETPADRIVKFVSMNEGFRAFRVGALLRVGR